MLAVLHGEIFYALTGIASLLFVFCLSCASLACMTVSTPVLLLTSYIACLSYQHFAAQGDQSFFFRIVESFR